MLHEGIIEQKFPIFESCPTLEETLIKHPFLIITFVDIKEKSVITTASSISASRETIAVGAIIVGKFIQHKS